jgi:hypothetical protein
MKRLLALAICAALALSACESWPVNTTPYNPPTPVPSRTPFIRTPTPVVVSPSPVVSISKTFTPAGPSATPSASEATATATLTPTEAMTLTPAAPPGILKAVILGCDTSIDISHGMGEVTNAYVTISNATSGDINDLCTTLNALDEGRPHPDKTKCIPTLAAGYQVTFKLTVDSTYKAQTPIQIDVNAGANLLLRAGSAACTDIGLLAPAPDDVGVPTPITQNP